MELGIEWLLGVCRLAGMGWIGKAPECFQAGEAAETLQAALAVSLREVQWSEKSNVAGLYRLEHAST